MKCSVVSYSLSESPTDLFEWKHHLLEEVKQLLSEGAELILYPELFLLGLTKYFPSKELTDQLKQISYFVQSILLPELSALIANRDILLILGTGPRDVKGQLFNSAPVFVNQGWSFQDKLFLTPWETDFTAGDKLNLFTFQGLKTAVIVCFDSEQPDLALKLKKEGVDLVLVPSATADRNGSNRVNRCASARAVELGAAVITAPLVGQSDCDLVDHNEGRQGFFLPAQEKVTCEQECYSDYSKGKRVIAHYQLDADMLKAIKGSSTETRPYQKPVHSSLTTVFNGKARF